MRCRRRMCVRCTRSYVRLALPASRHRRSCRRTRFHHSLMCNSPIQRN